MGNPTAAAWMLSPESFLIVDSMQSQGRPRRVSGAEVEPSIRSGHVAAGAPECAAGRVTISGAPTRTLSNWPGEVDFRRSASGGIFAAEPLPGHAFRGDASFLPIGDSAPCGVRVTQSRPAAVIVDGPPPDTALHLLGA